jgi:streptogramin lyase
VVYRAGWRESRADHTAGTDHRVPIAHRRHATELDPDGNLWFTESNQQTGAARIARITPQGQVTEFGSFAAWAGPGSIVVGPDNNLWFTERQGIGRITVSGQVTEFPVTNASGHIAPGPDGNLWFTDTLNARIGYITTSGQATWLPNSFPGDPIGVTTGPDGNLWMAENLDRIARVELADLTATPSTLDYGSSPSLRTSLASTLANHGHAPVTLNSFTISGPNASEFGFELPSRGDCMKGRVLNPGQSCQVRVRFAPASLGAKQATVTVANDATRGPLTIALKANV